MSARLPVLMVALSGLTAVSAPAVAGSIYCLGTVDALSTQADGAVSIETAWHGQAVQVCNVETVWKSVPVETCRRWHAQLSLALSTRDGMLVYYPNTTAADCAQMGAGSSADAPGFFANQ